MEAIRLSLDEIWYIFRTDLVKIVHKPFCHARKISITYIVK